MRIFFKKCFTICSKKKKAEFSVSRLKSKSGIWEMVWFGRGSWGAICVSGLVEWDSQGWNLGWCLKKMVKETEPVRDTEEEKRRLEKNLDQREAREKTSGAAKSIMAPEGCGRGTKKGLLFHTQTPGNIPACGFNRSSGMGARSSGLNCAAVGRFRGWGTVYVTLWSSLFVNQVGTSQEPWCTGSWRLRPKGTRGRAGPYEGLAWGIHHGVPGHAQAWLLISLSVSPSILSTIFSRLQFNLSRHEASKTIPSPA